MAQSSGFFNSLVQNGVYDRKYNASDYSDNLAVVIGNGILRNSENALQVTASGKVVSVATGRAFIEGHYYKNDTTYTFTETTAPTTGARYDRIMLRLSTDVGAYGTTTTRNIRLVYVEGTAANEPTPPEPTRTSSTYDLVLANVYIVAGGTSVTITDTRGTSGLCGWLYSNTKGFLNMRYQYSITLATASNTVQFSISQYESDKGFLEVFVNGILRNTSTYTVSGTTITFNNSLVAGTKVTVYFYKSIEETGIDSVASLITTLQTQMAQVQGVAKFTYQCSGLNDNIAISEIVQALYSGSYTVGSLSANAEAFLSNIGGNTYLATLTSESQVTIDIIGKLGATTPAGGSGTTASRYKWFNVGLASVSSKRITLDFAHCDQINITCTAGTSNIIFYGTDLYIRNCKCFAYCSSGSTPITMATSDNYLGRQQFDNCFFKIVTTGAAIIGDNGEFTNCLLHVKSSTDNAYCVLGQNTNALIQLNNCILAAYTATSGKFSAPLGILAAATNAVIMAQNINAPVIAQSGYSQTNLCVSNGGYIQVYGVISTLTSAGDSSKRAISGQISKNKH